MCTFPQRLLFPERQLSLWNSKANQLFIMFIHWWHNDLQPWLKMNAYEKEIQLKAVCYK
jgi:hypothetical protein